MPETVRMALARCCQRQTNVTVQEKKVSWSLPLDKGHFITGFEKSRAQRGWPVLDKTGKILDNFCKLSNNQYGTRFELAEGYAKVKMKSEE